MGDGHSEARKRRKSPPRKETDTIPCKGEKNWNNQGPKTLKRKDFENKGRETKSSSP